MINKQQALTLQEFHHVTLRNKDGTPLRARKTGQCRLWKTRPTHFKVPVKYGMYTSLYITHENAHEWAISPAAAVVEGAGL